GRGRTNPDRGRSHRRFARLWSGRAGAAIQNERAHRRSQRTGSVAARRINANGMAKIKYRLSVAEGCSQESSQSAARCLQRDSEHQADRATRRKQPISYRFWFLNLARQMLCTDSVTQLRSESKRK